MCVCVYIHIYIYIYIYYIYIYIYIYIWERERQRGRREGGIRKYSLKVVFTCLHVRPRYRKSIFWIRPCENQEVIDVMSSLGISNRTKRFARKSNSDSPFFTRPTCWHCKLLSLLRHITHSCTDLCLRRHVKGTPIGDLVRLAKSGTRFQQD